MPEVLSVAGLPRQQRQRIRLENQGGEIGRGNYSIPDARSRDDAGERARHQLRKQIIDEGERGNWKPLYDARANGLLDAEEARQLRHDVQLGPLAARVNHFKYSDFMKVYEAAKPEEKKQLDPVRERKRANLLRRGEGAKVSAAESE